MLPPWSFGTNILDDILVFSVVIALLSGSNLTALWQKCGLVEIQSNTLAEDVQRQRGWADRTRTHTYQDEDHPTT